MSLSDSEDRRAFREAAEGLSRGDFSRLEPLFGRDADDASSCAILDWFAKGWFDDEPAARDEAFSCACFLGRRAIAERMLAGGVDSLGGARTGMNAFHWAANRGELAVVELLIERKSDLEARNRFGGTVLGTAIWSAIHEPKPTHLAVIEALLRAGAHIESGDFPSGDARVDELVSRYAAGR